MNILDLKPASEFARIYGCKTVCYGAPGSAKTPLTNTAPRPVMLACEPGLLSMRGSTVPTYQAFETSKIDDFFNWLTSSQEVKNFDTVCVDSISEMASIYLVEALKKNSHGMKAYGVMAENVEKQLRRLYFLPNMHTYLIAKQEIISETNYKRPYMPGKYLPVQLPHMFDFILHLGLQNVPGMGQVKAFRCIESFDTMARARTGNLLEFEEPHLAKLFAKAMS